jgi:hypothetical protein
VVLSGLFKKLRRAGIATNSGLVLSAEEGGAANDQIIDYKKLPPFFKKLFDEIDAVTII